MIIGIGSDLIDIPRIERAIGRHGDRFLDRIFTEVERAKAERRNKVPRMVLATYAKRFAAKEALGKALGIGVAKPATLPNIAVEHDALGKPSFSYAPELAQLLAERGLVAHLSISDEKEFALAFVVLEHA